MKGIQICANLIIRGIYTSSNIYNWDSLPKEMSFKMVKGGKWSDVYNFIYLPNSINPEKNISNIDNEQKQKDLQHSIVEREESTQRKKKI